MADMFEGFGEKKETPKNELDKEVLEENPAAEVDPMFLLAAFRKYFGHMNKSNYAATIKRANILLKKLEREVVVTLEEEEV